MKTNLTQNNITNDINKREIKKTFSEKSKLTRVYQLTTTLYENPLTKNTIYARRLENDPTRKIYNKKKRLTDYLVTMDKSQQTPSANLKNKE